MEKITYKDAINKNGVREDNIDKKLRKKQNMKIIIGYLRPSFLKSEDAEALHFLFE